MSLAANRRSKILERVAEGKPIEVAELARLFGCSEMTIRRDIHKLESDGFLRRTYGGATAHLTRALDLAFNPRSLKHAREKRLIGLTAARLCSEARFLFVGMGTTAEQFARYLSARPETTVATGSLLIASLLGTRPIQTIALGGSIRRDELTCIGPTARWTLERFRFDVAVLGAAGVSAREGVTEVNDDEAEVERLAIERSDRLVIIADGSKLGVVTSSIVAPASRIETLVTDASAPPAELEALRACGVRVVTATGGGGDGDPAGGEPDAATWTLAGASPR